jgi:ATP-binding cassette subfamily C protein CydD
VLPLLPLVLILRRRLRDRAARTVGDTLFAALSSQLLAHRRALIRRKPLSAWQDFHSRHLPALETYLVDYQVQLWMVASLPVLVIALILPISWLAALGLILTMPLIPLFMWLVGRGSAALQERHIVALDRLGGIFGDRLLGRQTIRLHNASAAEVARFDNASRALNERLAEVLRVAFLSGTVLDFFSTLSIAVVAVLTGFALLGEVSIGFYGQRPNLTQALFILLLAPAFFAELKALGRLYHVRNEALGAPAAWQEVLRKDEYAPASQTAEFRGLSVRSGSVLGFDDQPLLRIDELRLERGDRVLLRGPSGAGKTVLLEAIAGQRPLTGQVTLNGNRMHDLGDLRDQTLMLDQQPTVFPGAVRTIVGLDRHDDQAVTEALVSVGLGEWLARLPAGLDTLFDDAPALSGGQRQRLAVARLCLFRPPLILLDEPAAHLSVSEQEQLNRLLYDLLGNATVLWASHGPLREEWFSRSWRIDALQSPATLRT